MSWIDDASLAKEILILELGAIKTARHVQLLAADNDYLLSGKNLFGNN